MIAPMVTPMGLYVAASVIVAICDRSPHSAPDPGHQLGRLQGLKRHFTGPTFSRKMRVAV